MDRLEILLDMIEHPERYTEQQMHELLADKEIRKHYDVMVRLREAYDERKVKSEEVRSEEVKSEVSSDQGRARHSSFFTRHSSFVTRHSSFDTRHSSFFTLHSSFFTLHSSFRKIAAIFLVAAFLGGLVWAVSPFLRPREKAPQSAEVTTLPHEGEQRGGLEREGGLLRFSDVRLDSILAIVGAHYDCKVRFTDSAAMGMKFFITWNPEDSIEAFIVHLNMFDGLELTLRDDTIIVESIDGEEDAQ